VVGDGILHRHARVVATRLVPAARFVADELGTVALEHHLRVMQCRMRGIDSVLAAGLQALSVDAPGC
jgi:hypothetical protein